MSTIDYQAPRPSLYEPGRSSRSLRLFLDSLTTGGAMAGGACIMVMLILLVAVLINGAWPAIQKFGISFLWTSGWDRDEKFGAWPVIQGTLISSVLALFFGVPISVGAAVFLVRVVPSIRGIWWTATRVAVSKLLTVIVFVLAYGILRNWMAHGVALVIAIVASLSLGSLTFAKVRNGHIVGTCSFLIELLAAIPSITYGLWGVCVLVPFVHKNIAPVFTHTVATWHWFQWGVIKTRFTEEPWYFPGGLFTPTATPTNILCAGLVLAIMITPIMTSITRDVLRSVPKDLEQGAYGLGATWWQATKVVLSFSKLGILGAVILGLGRALGETMAVTAVIGGRVDRPISNLFSDSSTISSVLANEFPSPETETHRQALVYTALVLLLVTMVINGAARVMVISIGRKK